MVKSRDKQIEILDRIILPVYGFQNVRDYDYVLTTQTLDTIEDLMVHVDHLIPIIKQYFPVKNFNFHKTQNHVIDHQQAFSILKKCLEIAGVPYELSYCTQQGQKIKQLRLFREKISKIHIYNKTMEKSSGRTSVSFGKTFEQISTGQPVIEDFETLPELAIMSDKNLSTGIYIDHIKNLTQWQTKTYLIPLETCVVDCQHYSRAKISSDEYDFLHGWMKSLTIKLESENSETTHNNYDLRVGGQLIYSHSLGDDNLLPYESIIPFGLTAYHDWEIELLLDASIYPQRASINLSLTVVLADRHDFDQSKIYNIPWGIVRNVQNYLRVQSGMAGLCLTAGSVFSDSYLSFVEILSHYEERDHLRICHLDNQTNISTQTIMEWVKKPDIDLLTYNYTFDKHKYYVDLSSKMTIITQLLPKMSDLITNIVVQFNQPLLVNVKFFVCDVPLKFKTEDRQTYVITTYDDQCLLNVLSVPQMNMTMQLETVSVQHLAYQVRMKLYYVIKNEHRKNLVIPSKISHKYGYLLAKLALVS
jgi:hypothetical protein